MRPIDVLALGRKLAPLFLHFLPGFVKKEGNDMWKDRMGGVEVWRIVWE